MTKLHLKQSVKDIIFSVLIISVFVCTNELIKTIDTKPKSTNNVIVRRVINDDKMPTKTFKEMEAK